jgi:hypothetical protein
MSPRAHVTSHCLVEGMLRGRESPYRERLEELMGQGQSRHEAICSGYFAVKPP